MRRWVKVLLTALLAGALAVGYGSWRWNRLLADQGVRQLDWQGLHMTRQGIALDSLDLLREGPYGRQRIRAENLKMSLPVFDWGHIRIQRLSSERLLFDWQAAQQNPEKDGPTDWSAVLDALQWLPETVRIDSFEGILPCPRGRCVLSGMLSFDRARSGTFPLALLLVLRQDDLQAAINAVLDKGPDGWHLRTRAELDGQTLLQLDGRLLDRDTVLSGTLRIPQLPDTGALFNGLNRWFPDSEQFLQAPGGMRMDVDWRIGLLDDGQAFALDRVLDGEGQIDIRAGFPDPWPIPHVGKLQGTVDMTWQGRLRQWRPTRLRTALRLTELSVIWPDDLPPAWRPEAVTLQSTPIEGEADASLGAQLNLTVEGPVSGNLHGHVMLVSLSPWHLMLDQGQIDILGETLQYGTWHAQRVRLQAPFSGQLEKGLGTLSFGAGARLDVQALTESSDLQLPLRVDFGGTHLHVRQGDAAFDTTFSGPVTLSTGALRQPLLKTQHWQFNGALNASRQGFVFSGELENAARLQAQMDIDYSLRSGLQVDMRVPEMFFRQGNPLSATFAHWPDTLLLNNGRLQGNGSLTWRAAGQPVLTLEAPLQGVGGVFDRAELQGLTGTLTFHLQDERLTVTTPGLTLEQINPGIPLGPARLQGRYRAPLDRLNEGRLDWRVAEAGLFGGQVRIPAGRLELALPAQRFGVELEGLAIEQLLQAYPAEGLSGKGTLEGRLPIMIDRDALTVAGGQVQAREPGYLRFRSEKIRAMGHGNPAMQLVADALDDFHYDRLSSDVDYAADGRLTLAVTLQGRNPDVEKGRQINLNVNLSEHLPNLFTSLQLSDRVGEQVRKHVEEKLRKKQEPAAP